MTTKANPGNYDCYKEAGDDEPIFILKSTDISAPDTVRFWAEQYMTRKVGVDGQANQMCEASRAKYIDAMKCAQEMEQWREVYVRKW